MSYVELISWGIILLGVLLSLALGRKASGWKASLGIALGLGFLLFFAINVALPKCVAAKLCSALGDTGVMYALYPLLAIPLFWLIAGVSAKRRQ